MASLEISEDIDLTNLDDKREFAFPITPFKREAITPFKREDNLSNTTTFKRNLFYWTKSSSKSSPPKPTMILRRI